MSTDGLSQLSQIRKDDQPEHPQEGGEPAIASNRVRGPSEPNEHGLVDYGAIEKKVEGDRMMLAKGVKGGRWDAANGGGRAWPA